MAAPAAGQPTLNKGAQLNQPAAGQAAGKPVLQIPNNKQPVDTGKRKTAPPLKGGRMPSSGAVKEHDLQRGQPDAVDRRRLQPGQSPGLELPSAGDGDDAGDEGPRVKMPAQRRGVAPAAVSPGTEQLQEPAVDTAPDMPAGRLPVPEHDSGGPSPCERSGRGPGSAAECVRERAAGARIDAIANYEARHGCVPELDVIELRGRGFGNRQGLRQALLTQSRRYRSRVAALTPVEWRDDFIRLDVPAYRVRRGVNYYVGIWTAGGEPLAPPKLMQFCIKQATVSGTVELHNCAAGGRDVSVEIQAGGGSVEREDVRPVPGNDFLWRYKESVELDPGRSITEVRVTPRLRPGVCAGEWQPGETVLEVSNRAPEARQNFVYRVGPQELRLPADILARLIQGQFEGTEVRINNYAGSRVSGGSWHKPWDSTLTLSAALGGHSEQFNIPEQRQGRRRFYVRDINLQNITVNARPDAFEVVMEFESGGPSELKGHCRVHGKVFGWRDCPVGSDKGAPDGQIDHMVWRIRLSPARFRGDLAYDEVDVDVEADIQAGGICTRTGGAATTYTAGSPVPLPVDLCDVVGNYKDRIRNQARDTLTDLLLLNRTKQQVADGLRSALDARGIGEVRGAEMSGGDLVVRYLPAGGG